MFYAQSTSAFIYQGNGGGGGGGIMTDLRAPGCGSHTGQTLRSRVQLAARMTGNGARVCVCVCDSVLRCEGNASNSVRTSWVGGRGTLRK